MAVATNQGQELCFTLLDLYSAYNQLWLEKSSRKYTGFMHPDQNRVIQSTRVVQGASNSVASYHRRVAEIFQHIDPLKVLTYVDDILCLSGKKDHPELLRKVFDTLRKYNLKMSPKKLQLAKKSIKYMGYHLSDKGTSVDESRIAALQLIKPPKDLHQLRQLLGQLNYVAKTVPRYNILIDGMRKLLKKDTKFIWNDEAQKSLDDVKYQLTQQVILSHPDTSRRYKLSIDSSRKGIGFCILQEDRETGIFMPVAYGGRGLTEFERNKLGVSELELTGVAFALQKHRVLLNNGCTHIVRLTIYQIAGYIH